MAYYKPTIWAQNNKAVKATTRTGEPPNQAVYAVLTPALVVWTREASTT